MMAPVSIWLVVTVTLIGGFWAVMSQSALALNSECHIQGDFDFRGPGPWPIILSVPAAGCTRLSFEGGSHMRYAKLFIDKKPLNGRLTLHEGGYYSYLPKRGYRGPDAFHLEICRINRRQEERCTAVHFEVRVR